MFQSKDLTADQIASLRQWAAEGDQLADLQRKLKEEYALNVTYMDMRFVVLDLGLEIQQEEEPEPESAKEEAAEVVSEDLPSPGMGMGRVSVSVDQITAPGAMVSGRVTFSDGENGRWMIDQMGRPSLDPDTAGYQPTHDDLVAFQNELRQALEGGGGLGL